MPGPISLQGSFDSARPLASEWTGSAQDDILTAMTRRRWIADEVSGSHAALVGSHADHLAHVLRARIGQEFDIATAENVRRGRIVSITDGRVEFELGEVVPSAAIPTLTLLLSIFKFDRMEWAIEKCVELGAARIVPWSLNAPKRILPPRRQSEWNGGNALPARHPSSPAELRFRKSPSRSSLTRQLLQQPASGSCWPNRKSKCL